MLNELFSKLTEGQGSTAKEILSSNEWNKFDFKVADREFCDEVGCTKKTKSEGTTDHEKAANGSEASK